MAEAEVAQWTVFIMAENDQNLIGSYQISPTTTLSEVMQIWKKDNDLGGYWVFKSVHENITFHDNWMTLEMIGKAAYADIVTLKAALIDEPVPRPLSEISIFVNDKLRHLSVKSNDKLYEVLCQIPGGPKQFEFNGSPLNVKHTLTRAGLQNRSVIHESLRSVAVKLSTGYTKVFQMPSSSLVFHLKEKVNEINEFSLNYQGRHLKSEESIMHLEQVVEVTTADFAVLLNGRRVSWTTKNEPIAVSEFISQLAIKGSIDSQELENMEFVCIGCQRHIRTSNDYTQQIPMDCCKERSLTLNAIASLDTGTNPEKNDLAKHFQRLHKLFEQCRVKDAKTEDERCILREMRDIFEKKGVNYNIITQCSQKLLKNISDLENKICKLKGDIEKLQAMNVRGTEEIEKLKEDNRKLDEANKRLDEENAKMSEQLGVKLHIFYRRDKFFPNSLPEIQKQGVYPWDTNWPYIQCQIPTIRPGSTSFEEVCDVLQKFVSGPKIMEIAQRRGAVEGREVTRVTTYDDDVALNPDKSPYCDVHGAQYSWEEAGKPMRLFMSTDGRVFLCGGRRRTVIAIY